MFDGVLSNRIELERELGLSGRSPASDAALMLAACTRWGDGAIAKARGMFVLVVCDSKRGRVVAARDPIGLYPLYWTAAGSNVFFSTSANRLVEEKGVSRAVNRAALADMLRHNFPDLEETYLSAVKRVPAGHRLQLDESPPRIVRYWDPAPPGAPIDWVGDEEVDRFDELLDQAVGRCLALGRSGIQLSGGLDSVTVAAVAAELAHRKELPLPLALSLSFPHPDSNEEPVQRAVASQLGLPQVMRRFDDAVGSKGLLREALALARRWPQPLLNVWLPAYQSLVREGIDRGCGVVFTGTGGDEWLTVSPYYGADLMRAHDIAGLVALWKSFRRSYRHSLPALTKTMLWTFGLRPLLGRFGRAAAPGLMRRRQLGEVSRSTPAWVAPDKRLRRELAERVERAPTPSDADGIYVREVRRSLDHPMVALEYEERFENGRDLGVHEVHPFLDADLVDFLFRVPPRLLDRGGRAKGLVRHSLARRFPELGFDRHRKMNATAFLQEILLAQCEAARRDLGGLPALSDLGVIDPNGWQAAYESMRSHERRDVYRIWEVFSAEAWVQGRA